MDSDFWHARWNAGQIGFHEGAPNAQLVKHSARLGEGRCVLVPLCGKTLDLAFLASAGHRVVGVELVESAVRAFFQEQGITPEVTTVGAFTRFGSHGLTLLCGDFFATTRELVGPVDALYDRAALIALPEPMRAVYSKHVGTLLPAGATGLMITVEYPQELKAGPPFSVPEAELRAHYPGASLECVGEAAAGGSLATVAARERCFAARF